MKNTRLIFAGLSLFIFSGLTQADSEIRMNEGLPVMVDSKTELNDISIQGNTITYSFTLKDMSLDEVLDARQENKAIIENNACADENIHCLFDKDFDVRFVYKLDDKQILEVNLDKQFCHNKKQQLS